MTLKASNKFWGHSAYSWNWPKIKPTSQVKLGQISETHVSSSDYNEGDNILGFFLKSSIVHLFMMVKITWYKGSCNERKEREWKSLENDTQCFEGENGNWSIIMNEWIKLYLIKIRYFYSWYHIYTIFPNMIKLERACSIKSFCVPPRGEYFEGICLSCSK